MGPAMVTREEAAAARRRATSILASSGIVLTPAESDAIEIADFGLSRLEQTGLEVVVYVNTERVCAKELVMFPRQLCPEHTSIRPSTGPPGKGKDLPLSYHGVVYLYVEGEPAADAGRARARRRGASTSGMRSSCSRVINTRSSRTRCTGSRRVTRARSFPSSRRKAATSSTCSSDPQVQRATELR